MVKEKDLDVVMLMYTLTKYCDYLFKNIWIFLTIFQGYSNDTATTDSESFKSKVKTTGKTPLILVIQKCWNSSTIKLLKSCLENSWNSYN